MNRCKSCKHWSEKVPPAIGKCDITSKTTLFDQCCSNFKLIDKDDFFDVFSKITGAKYGK